MGNRVSERAFFIILSGLADDGVDSGYFGNRLKGLCCWYEANCQSYRIRIVLLLIEPFLDSIELAEMRGGHLSMSDENTMGLRQQGEEGHRFS